MPFPVHQPLCCCGLRLCDWIAARYDRPQARRGHSPQLVFRRPRRAEVHLCNQILHKTAGPSGFRSILVRLYLGLLPADGPGAAGMPQLPAWREALQMRAGRLGASATLRSAFRAAPMLGLAKRQSGRLSAARPTLSSSPPTGRSGSLFSALHLPMRWLSLLKGFMQSTAEPVPPSRRIGNGSAPHLALQLQHSRPALVQSAAQGRRCNPAGLEPSKAASFQSVFSIAAPLPYSASLRLCVNSPRDGSDLWRMLEGWTKRLRSPALSSWAFPTTDTTHPLSWGPPWQQWIQHWWSAYRATDGRGLLQEAAKILALPPQLRHRWQSAGPSGASRRSPAANGDFGPRPVDKATATLLPHSGRQPLQLMVARPQQALSQQALKAVQSRGAEAALAPQTDPTPSAPGIDLHQLTHQVSDELERRIRTERERRGL